MRNGLEAAPGFEPGNKGFADPRLTTWLCRRHFLAAQRLIPHSVTARQAKTVRWTLALRPGPTRPSVFPRLGCAPPLRALEWPVATVSEMQAAPSGARPLSRPPGSIAKEF